MSQIRNKVYGQCENNLGYSETLQEFIEKSKSWDWVSRVKGVYDDRKEYQMACSAHE